MSQPEISLILGIVGAGLGVGGLSLCNALLKKRDFTKIKTFDQPRSEGVPAVLRCMVRIQPEWPIVTLFHISTRNKLLPHTPCNHFFILLLGPLITAPRFLPCHLYMYKIFRISILLAVSSNTSIVIVSFRTYCRALLVELISGDKKSSTWSDDSGGWWSSFYLLVRRLNPTNRLLKSIISSFSTSPFSSSPPASVLFFMVQVLI